MFTEYTTHYRSIFFLQPHQLTPQEEAWESAVNHIYQWLNRGIRRAGGRLFSLQSFFCASPGDRPWESHGISVKTQCSGETHPPRLWSCRYEHPDRDGPGRRWRVDIGIECLSDLSLRIGIRVAYSLNDNHIGEQPPIPAPSVPVAIRALMQQEDSWTVRLGSLRLSLAPRMFQTGEIKELWDILRDPRREGPVVVVAADYKGEFSIPLDRLGSELVGVAEVCAIPYETQDEQRHIIPDGYHCFPGSVRVYSQGIDLDRESDKGRHRYFTNYQIRQLGEEQVRRWIVRSLVRRATLAQPEAIFAPADIERAQRAERLAQLGRQVEELRSANTQSDTYYEMYSNLLDQREAEFKQIIAGLEQRNLALQEEVLSEAIQREATQEEKERIQGELDGLQYELQSGYSAKEIPRLHEEISRLNSSLSAVNTLSALPRNMGEVAELAGKLWPNRIVFTPRALASAQATACKEQGTLWAGLYHMAHTLWPLYFEKEQYQEAEEAFDSTAAPWKLARGESPTTRQDPKLMRLRTDHFEGREIYFEPHIRYGNVAPRLLRIHFHRDNECRRLIIGHCGNHLDTSST